MNSDFTQRLPQRRASNVVAALVAMAFLATATQSFAERDGRSGRAGNTTRACTSCHAAGAAVPTVAFSSPATTVAPGSTTTYTVTITAGAGGPAAGSGIDVAASVGTLSVTDAGTKLSDATTTGAVVGEIVHNAPKPMAAGAVTYTFAWTAPTTPGTATLYVAGMATNGVLDDRGDSVTLITLPVTVGAAATNQPPVAVITGPGSGAANVPVSLSGSTSTDPDGTIATYDWNFGDGTAGSGVNVTHSFAAGTWAVVLTVTDNQGATGTAMMPITIAAAGTNVPPTANAGGPYNGTIGATITFNGGASTDPDGTISSYAWDFGDATTPGTGATTTHSYTAAGNFTATLTVTDNAGATATSQTAVTITAPTTTPPTNPPPGATTGQTLYVANCETCHGVNGLGGPDGDVAGASADDIAEALVDVPEMAGIALTNATDIQAIADFLATEEEDSVGDGATIDDASRGVNSRGQAQRGAGGIDAWLLTGLFGWSAARLRQRRRDNTTSQSTND